MAIKTQKGLVKEFNRLYANITELHTRIFSEKKYPKHACAIRFVSDLQDLIIDPNLNKMLTEQQINEIGSMAIDVHKTHLITNREDKQLLSSLIRELKVLKTTITQVSGL